MIFLRQRRGDIRGFDLRSIFLRTRERTRKVNRQILGRQLECPAGGEHENEYSSVLTQSWPIETTKPEKMMKAIPWRHKTPFTESSGSWV